MCLQYGQTPVQPRKTLSLYNGITVKRDARSHAAIHEADVQLIP